MSNQKPTNREIEIRIFSDKSNPYASECPGRHLWSEGFRAGAKHVDWEMQSLKTRIESLEKDKKYLLKTLDEKNQFPLAVPQGGFQIAFMKNDIATTDGKGILLLSSKDYETFTKKP